MSKVEMINLLHDSSALCGEGTVGQEGECGFERPTMGVGPTVSCAAADKAGDGVRCQLQHTVKEGVDTTCGTRQGSLPCCRYQMREETG